MILVYVMIALRGVRGFAIPPWASMLMGGVLMIATSVETVKQAIQSIDLNVILFLISLFTISSALEVSGILRYIAGAIIRKAKTGNRLTFLIMLVSALLSLFITNDGVSTTFTPIIIESSKLTKTDPKPLLFSLAFGVTIGSVMMPTGNPQNLLIALQSGLRTPFISFVEFLTIPTFLNIILTFYMIKLFFKPEVVINEIPPLSVKDSF
ncbi:hypothetical protein HS7_05260 [Sulfolobales archaeon HS-7]|nr:hypothetical protein HS7_05260 [Sulfolobales archaeon HS-7]